MQYNLGPTATAIASASSPILRNITFTGIYGGYTAQTALTGDGTIANSNWLSYSGVPASTVIRSVDSPTQITLNHHAGVIGTINITFGGACNADFTSYPLPPTVTAKRVAVTDLPDIPYAFQLDVTAGSSNTSHQSFLGFAQYLKGHDAGRLAHGTASAQDTTVSMWLKPNASGNVGVSLQSRNGLRQWFWMCPVAANVWNQCVKTVPGDTKTTSTSCNSVTASAAATWASSGQAADNYMVIAVVFEAGSDFQGVPERWQCYAGADNRQTQFSQASGFSVQMSAVSIVPEQSR
jgi:hypothetical protein